MPEKDLTFDKSQFNLCFEILENKLASSVVPFPKAHKTKGSFNIQMVLVTSQEMHKIKMVALIETKKHYKNAGFAEMTPKELEETKIFNDWVGYGLCVESCRDLIDVNKKLFPTAEILQQVLDPDEVGVLCNHYMHLQRTKGCIISNMSQQEIDALIERLISDSTVDAGFFSNFVYSGDLPILLNGLVCQLRNYQTNNLCSTPAPSNTQENQTNTNT
jgi:hypothetical protein